LEEESMKLRSRALGLALGVFGGSVLFLLSIASIVLGGKGEVVGFFANVVPGYRNTFLGAAFGLVCGFIEGFVLGVIIAWLYNRFHKMLYKTEVSH
jgi:hypothetical protein